MARTMNRREFLKKGAAFTALGSLLPPFLLSESLASENTNIVFIIADQHRWDVTGCYGNDCVGTRNIDRLANEGVRFDNMYCQFPLCVPSRQSIITSQYPSTHGTIKNSVPVGKETSIDYLRDCRGYGTCLVGKSHMSPEGFELCYDKIYLDANLPPYIKDARDDALNWYYTQYSGEQAEETKAMINSNYLVYPMKEMYFDDSLTCWGTGKVLDKLLMRPLFMWVSFVRPHTDWSSPDHFMTKYSNAELPWVDPATPDIIDGLPQYLQNRFYEEGIEHLDQEDIQNCTRAYYAGVGYMDNLLGRVLDYLDAHNLVQDTIVIYTADHGEMMGHNGIFFKRCFYEPAVHVPCIIRYPGVIPAGRVVTQLTETIDIMPTVMDFAQIPLQGTEEGESMRNLIMDPEDPTWKNQAFAEGNDHYLQNDNRHIMYRRGDFKYNYYSDDLDQLFELSNDPNERSNLIDIPKYGHVVTDMQERISEKFGVEF